MVIHAYDEEYFESARRIMGDLFDFAMVTAGVSPETLQKMMITSSSIRQFEKGNPAYVAGMTGCELFIKMVEESGLSIKIPAEEMYLDKSPEYWSGWAIAFISGTVEKPLRGYLNILTSKSCLICIRYFTRWISCSLWISLMNTCGPPIR